jgi:hypothetical protein
MSDFFTGYDPTIENRDEIRATSTELGFRVGDYEAPEEIDFRKLIRHDDQSRMNSCGAFGNTNCGEGLWALSHGAISEERQFSPTFTYIETQRRDGNGLFGVDRGSTVSGGLWVSRLRTREMPRRLSLTKCERLQAPLRSARIPGWIRMTQSKTTSLRA